MITIKMYRCIAIHDQTKRVLGALRKAFNKVDEADRDMEGPQIADLEKMATTGNVEWGSSVGNIFNRGHTK